MKSFIKKWWLVILAGLFGVMAALNVQAQQPNYELRFNGKPVGVTCTKPTDCWMVCLRITTRNPQIDMLPGDTEVMQAIGWDVKKISWRVDLYPSRGQFLV